MSLIAKAGKFSDGGFRIRVVAPGYDADPAPSDPRAIIYDSDWPELVRSRPGYYGSQSVVYSTNASGANTSSNYTISWPALGYAPKMTLGQPRRFASPPAYSVYGSAAFQAAIANAMELSLHDETTTDVTPTASGFTYVPSGADGYSSPDNETYSIAWWAMLFDTTLLGNAAPVSRAGANYMKLSKDGPVVARPGADVSSTNPDDFLIAPIAMAAMLGQPLLAATLSSLPAYNSFGIYDPVSHATTTYYEYMTTVAHGLGYMPFALTTNAFDFRAGPSPAAVFVDATNVYLYAYSLTNAATLTVAPTSYFIFRPRWF